MSEELKPCPFCGQPAISYRDQDGYLKIGCINHCAPGIDLDDWQNRPLEDALRQQLEAAQARIQQLDEFVMVLQDDKAAAQEAKNGAYSERDKLVALLSSLFPSSLERHQPEDDDWEDDWRWLVFIDLPMGQVSWHIHDSELPLFDHLPRKVGRVWDGHTTEQKYRRVALETMSNHYDLRSALAYIEKLKAIIERGYELSAYAAAINWDNSPNTQEWLDGLRERIEAFQTMVKPPSQESA